MKRITSIRLTTTMAIVVAIVVFFLVNLTSGFLLNSRIDLTENNIFTLSDGTHRVVEKIEEPIRMRMYYSDSLAQGLGAIQSYAQRVRGLLEQYAGISGGNIVVEFIDPEPFSTEEDQAAAFGLQAVPINSAQQQLFFGLAVSDSVDNTEVIPFFTQERETFLEYDISRLLYDLGNPDKPRVGVLSWLPESQGNTPVFFQQLTEQFQVENLETGQTTLPESLDTLLVIHPQPSINTDLAYAIDQYLLNNGKLIVFVDPANEDRQAGTAPFSDLNNLFSAWGVRYDANQVAADPQSSLRVNIQTATGNRPINHPAWLQLGSDAFNTDSPITSDLNQVRFIGAGSLGVDTSKDSVQFIPLVTTSNQSGQISRTIIQSPDPRLWQSGIQPVDKPLVLAGHYTGTFTTAFPEKSDENHLAVSALSSNLIVIADVDLLLDRYWVEVRNLLGQQLVLRSADNGTMIINAVDNMVGSSDLISLRSRGVRERNFSVVSQLRQQAESEFQEQQENLQNQLRQAEERINALQRNKGSDDARIINDEQQKEIQRFRQQRADTRQELRELQLRLNRDIESLGSWLKFINIMLIPILILLLSFFLPAWIGRKKS